MGPVAILILASTHMFAAGVSPPATLNIPAETQITVSNILAASIPPQTVQSRPGRIWYMSLVPQPEWLIMLMIFSKLKLITVVKIIAEFVVKTIMQVTLAFKEYVSSLPQMGTFKNLLNQFLFLLTASLLSIKIYSTDHNICHMIQFLASRFT